MNYTSEELRAMPENILLKYTLVYYEEKNPNQNPDDGIVAILKAAGIQGVSKSALNNFKSGKGCLCRKAWRAIYNVTHFELIKEWDASNRIGGEQ